MKDIYIVLYIFYFLRLFNVFFAEELRQESMTTAVCLYKRKILLCKTKIRKKKNDFALHNECTCYKCNRLTLKFSGITQTYY